MLGEKWRKKEKWGKWKGESEKEEMGKVKKRKWGKWKRGSGGSEKGEKGRGKGKQGEERREKEWKGGKKREIIFYSLVLARTENWMKPFEEKYIFPWKEKGKGKRKRGKEKGKGEKKEGIYLWSPFSGKISLNDNIMFSPVRRLVCYGAFITE